MGNWEDTLIKTRLDSGLMEEPRSELGARLSGDIQAVLSKQVKTKTDIKTVRETIKAIQGGIQADLAREIDAQLNEISEDLEYTKTDLGKTVLTVNRWLERWSDPTLRGDKAFDDILIGANAEKPLHVYVTGKVGMAADFDKLQSIIEANNPPFDVLYDVQITG